MKTPALKKRSTPMVNAHVASTGRIQTPVDHLGGALITRDHPSVVV
jgi:hypothetical protein